MEKYTVVARRPDEAPQAAPPPRLPRHGPMSRIPSSATGQETAVRKRQLDYQITVYFIITETPALAAELGIRPFPHVAATATTRRMVL